MDVTPQFSWLWIKFIALIIGLLSTTAGLLFCIWAAITHDEEKSRQRSKKPRFTSYQERLIIAAMIYVCIVVGLISEHYAQTTHNKIFAGLGLAAWSVALIPGIIAWCLVTRKQIKAGKKSSRPLYEHCDSYKNCPDPKQCGTILTSLSGKL